MLRFKRIIARTILLIVFGLSYTTTNAQSTVYFFMRSSYNAENMLSMNGKELFEIKGPLKRTQKAVGKMQIPLDTYSPAYRKCEFKEEGKTLFSIEYHYTNPTTLKVTTMAAEIQANLSDGSIHYFKITSKGLNDIQFVELTKKEAEKLMKNKKYVVLPDYVE